jgi:hypothetical protein
MAAEYLVCRLAAAVKVFSRTLRLSMAVIGMLSWIVVVGQSSATDESCWPVRNITFKGGSQEEVTKKAADFLIKVEDVPQHPYWPQGTSGVTLGVGWDAGYHSRAELKEMWAALGPDVLARIEEAAGKKGRAAQALIPELRVIEIPRSVSIQVLTRSLNEHYYPFVLQLFPGLERLPAEVQVVFISVVFNRGASMGGDPDWKTAKEVDRRWEMRRLRVDVEDADMFAIYAHLGTMKRLWETSGPRGLGLRRRDEQALIRPYVNQQLRWDENRERLKKKGLPPCPD